MLNKLIISLLVIFKKNNTSIIDELSKNISYFFFLKGLDEKFFSIQEIKLNFQRGDRIGIIITTKKPGPLIGKNGRLINDIKLYLNTIMDKNVFIIVEPVI